MNTPNDPPLPPRDELTEEEFSAWLLKNPKRADALIDVMQGYLEAKQGEMTPEQLEEGRMLQRQFQDEVADFLVPEQYNPRVDRLRVLFAQKRFSFEEVEEVRRAEQQLKQLLDTALGLNEPRRAKVMNALLDCQAQVKLFLQNVKKV